VDYSLSAARGCRKPGALCSLPPQVCWHGTCSFIRIVKSVRTSLSAISMVLALIGSSSVSAFIAAAHPICTVKHHDCGDAPTIKPCCCGDQSNLSDQSGPTTEKVTFSTTLLPVAVVAAARIVPTSTPGLTHSQLSPPRSSSVDLPTLFATLLI